MCRVGQAWRFPTIRDQEPGWIGPVGNEGQKEKGPRPDGCVYGKDISWQAARCWSKKALGGGREKGHFRLGMPVFLHVSHTDHLGDSSPSPIKSSTIGVITYPSSD